MSCLGTGRLPCPSIHLSGLRQCRALPKGHATGRRCVLRCQADEKDKSIADKVPEAAQRTIDALSALLGRDEDENQLAQSRPLQGTDVLLKSSYIHMKPKRCHQLILPAEEPQKEDGGVQWWSVPPSNQTAAPRRCSTGIHIYDTQSLMPQQIHHTQHKNLLCLQEGHRSRVCWQSSERGRPRAAADREAHEARKQQIRHPYGAFLSCGISVWQCQQWTPSIQGNP